MLNGKKASKKQVKQLEDAGFTGWKLNFDWVDCKFFTDAGRAASDFFCGNFTDYRIV